MANMIKQKKVKLSKGILEMKFMQKTKTKLDKEIEDEEGRAMYSDEITDKMLFKQNNFVTEQSYVACEGLIREGRFSFRGMNPEIENYIEMEKQSKKQADRNRQKAEVSAEEMMKRYYDGSRTTSLSTNIGKKFWKRNGRNATSNANKDQKDANTENSKHKIVSANNHKNNNQNHFGVDMVKNTSKFMQYRS